MVNKFIQFFIIAIISFIISEIVLRLHDYQPFILTSYSIESTPESCIIPDSTLGFALNAGQYIVTINDKVKYTCTHTENRITTFIENSITPMMPTVDIHGCSFTYGMGVDDSLNYPYLVQQAMPTTKINNHACPGYGTIQALLKLQKAIIDKKIPKVCIINYAQFHDERNVLSNNFRLGLKTGFENSSKEIKPLFENSRIPYYSDGTIQYKQWNDLYHHWYLRTNSSVINALQIVAERFREYPETHRTTTFLIFKAIQKLCLENNIQLGIAIITKHPKNFEIIDFCKKENIPVLDMALDLPSEQYSHIPYDIHPNEKAHQYFAKKLTPFIHRLLE